MKLARAVVVTLCAAIVSVVWSAGAPVSGMASARPASPARRAHRGRSESCLPTPAGMRALPCPLHGVTVDDVSNVSGIVASEHRLARMPTTRVVFDVGSSVTSYGPALDALRPASYLMGELLDSSEEKQISARAEHARVARYLAAYASVVDIWEIGNEVNGNWLGSYSSVAAKLVDAYDQVSAAGERTALTLYANDLGPSHCGDGDSELTPAQFSQRYVPARVRDGLTLVLISYYEQNCGGRRPSASTWGHYFSALHALYPRATLGFGEIGLDNPVTGKTLSYAKGMVGYYYGLHLGVPDYIGGYFWWYYAEDAVPYMKPIWKTLNAALQAGPRRHRRGRLAHKFSALLVQIVPALRPGSAGGYGGLRVSSGWPGLA